MSNAPIRIAFPDDASRHDTCGCCDGTAMATLRPTDNRPNLRAIVFRAGEHGSFKSSMLTGLASAEHPALAGLRTRADDDFTIALIDAWASACDVLTFYQERLANEAYMGTALERLSVNELARLIGYRLHPGAAAETDLVIWMENPPGAAPDVAELDVPAGTRVQSQPGPGEEALTFETTEPLSARVDWNTLRPKLEEMSLPDVNATSVWIDGQSNLAVGDAVVFLARERWDPFHFNFDTDTSRYEFRRITKVAPSADGTRTQISWSGAITDLDNGSGNITPGLKLFHLQDRAALFGYNAPHPLALSEQQRDAYGYADGPLGNSPSTIGGTDGASEDWVFEFDTMTRLHLDNIYKSFTEDSWIVMQRPAGLTQVYRIDSTRDDTKAAYAISGKAMRLSLDTDRNMSSFETTYRTNTVYGGSREIAFAPRPVVTWVAGHEIDLDSRFEGLPEGRRLVFRGKRARLQVTAQSLTLIHDDGAARALLLGDVATLLDAPVPQGGMFRFRVADNTGFEGWVTTDTASFEPITAPDDAEEIAVSRLLKDVMAIDASHSRLRLEDPLGVAFDRVSLMIHANVARAAHGEGVSEILGHGDPSVPFQKFLLKQSPVTHRLAPTETGVASTLSVRVDGVEWQEVPDLYDRGASARVYKTALTDAGETVVEFGDGISGARPDPGRDNIQARHSRGLGAAGNLQAGQIKLPLDRPLGMKEAENPLPASGGADPEDLEDARRNAALYTLTLGRVVSLSDYRDFALGFPGIAKAEARWVWQGEARRIVVTVAGEDGAELAEGSATHTNLLTAFRDLGDPLVGVDLLSYEPATFRLDMKIKLDPAYDEGAVLITTEAHLREAFAFEARDFGAVLNLSEVAAAAHKVAGLVAVDIDRFYRTTGPQTLPIAHARLVSRVGRQTAGGVLLPGEILMLDPRPLDRLEVMS